MTLYLPMRCHAHARPLGRRPVKVIGTLLIFINPLSLADDGVQLGVAHPAAKGEYYE
jgi:hypothetical protein